jgi:hypothetical protein
MRRTRKAPDAVWGPLDWWLRTSAFDYEVAVDPPTGLELLVYSRRRRDDYLTVKPAQRQQAGRINVAKHAHRCAYGVFFNARSSSLLSELLKEARLPILFSGHLPLAQLVKLAGSRNAGKRWQPKPGATVLEIL